jgi:hypothetical protein
MATSATTKPTCAKCPADISQAQHGCLSCTTKEWFCSHQCARKHECTDAEKRKCPGCGDWVGREVWFNYTDEHGLVPKCLKCLAR